MFFTYTLRCDFKLIIPTKNIPPLAFWMGFRLAEVLHKFGGGNDIPQTARVPQDIVTVSAGMCGLSVRRGKDETRHLPDRGQLISSRTPGTSCNEAFTSRFN